MYGFTAKVSIEQNVNVRLRLNSINYSKYFSQKNHPINKRADFNCEIWNNQMTHVSCLSYTNAIIEDKRTDQSNFSVYH
jgi:hypothetical protein